MEPRPLMQSAPGPRTTIDGREYLYFAGTGYLGIHARPELVDAAADALRKYGMGSATTRAGFGNNPPVLEVERLAAAFFGCEASFYFGSGYAGPAVLSKLVEADVDAVFVDEASHYSVVDAARLTGKPTHTFAHRDAGALREALRARLGPDARPLVMTDGVFSVSGRIAPLPDYLDVLGAFPGACVAVDDAHAVGVLGERGRGTLEHFGLFDDRVNATTEACDRPRVLVCGTLSKAIGGSGGIVPGSAAFIDDVARRAPAYFAASAPPTPTAAATARALAIVMAEPHLRESLRANVRQLRSGLRGLGLAVDDSPTPIVSLDLGDAERMRCVQRRLMERGIAIAYHAAYSGVGPAGALRIAVFATHAPAMIDQLITALRQAV